MAVIVIFDQLVKYWVSTSMLPGMTFPVLGNVFSITYIENAGAAFGILANCRSFFIVATILILACGMYFYPTLKKQSLSLNLGVSLLLGGAVGNLIDRIRFGVVIDYFDFHIWPIFNISDMAIVSGVIIIIYHILREGTND